MTDRKQSINELHAQAVRDVEELLVKRGMDPTAAREIAAGAGDRILVSPGGQRRVLLRDLRQLYPYGAGNPLEGLAAELYSGAPSGVKAGPSEPTEEMLADARQRARGYL